MLAVASPPAEVDNHRPMSAVRRHSSVTIDVLQANVALLAEKERLEDERRRLLDLDRMRTEFLARVSHDLRTPLSSIIGFSELLLAEAGHVDARQVECLEAINRNGHALLAMITDLLDLSTLESGLLHLRCAAVPLTELVTDLRAATAPVLAAAGLEVTWPDPEPGAQAWCDRRRLLQALVNLVDNARKFTPRGGTLRLAAELVPAGVRFEVADSGPGIPESERERLFRPYAGGSGRTAGHGLGLAIVRAVVDRHAGRLEVLSAPGRGCTIAIVLPPGREPGKTESRP